MSAIDHINKTIKNLRDSIHQLEDLKKDMLKAEENSSAEYTSGETSAEYTSGETSSEYTSNAKTSWVHKKPAARSWESSAEYFSSEF
tara:strand:+ start:10047 stop:10307 length:261 start_codon:yes stop_codon:yes gene_type:complete